MKKELTRLFSVLLAAVLVFGTLPVSAMGTDVADPPASAADESAVDESSAVDDAAQPEEQSAEEENVALYASNDSFYKIVHLDCGRKYFTKDWIIALLYEMQYDGYNQLQLAFGNDGLRFLLNDMSFEANGTKYTNDTVVSRVKEANKKADNSNDERYLTQSEMDEIIATANKLGIEIVPLLNLPGHANAILDIANDEYNASFSGKKSDNTLDVTNDTAVAFAEAIFKKYVDYFAGKDCEFFNFGADEYANDVKGLSKASFGNLGQDGYTKFVAFINDLAKYICEKKMTPRAFNDGLYYQNSSDRYNGDTWNISYYTMDTNTYSYIREIQCCYWSPGWSDYFLASANTIENKGHALINTNGDYYYTLGNDDKFHSTGYSYAQNFNNRSFPALSGTSTISPAGSMFCIWCDAPNAETETTIAANTRLVLRAMAQRMDGQTVDVSESVVPGGFNADGTINKTTDDSLIKIAIGDSDEAASSATLSVDGSMILSASKAVVWDTENTDVIELTPVVADGANAIEAEKVQVTALKAGSAQITATSGDQTAYFSVTVQEPETKTIVVGEGRTSDPITVDGDWTDADTSALNRNIAEVAMEDIPGGPVYNPVTTDSLAAGEYYISAKPDDSAPTMQVSIEADNNKYYVKFNSRYWYPTSDWSNMGYQYTATSQPQKNNSTSVKIAKSGNGYYISNTASKRTSYLTISGNTFSGSNEETPIYFYTQGTADAKKQTKITFKGNAVGETSVTIGGVIYTIKVVDAAVADADPLEIEYWITNAKVYKSDKNSASSVKISAAEAYSEEGVAVEKSVPATANTYFNGDTAVSVYYWQTMRLADSDRQTAKDGNDGTSKGETLTHVRYQDKWQYKTLAGVWKDFQLDDQVVAYYLQKTEVTQEVITFAKDWGYGTSNDTPTNSEGQVALTVAVVYPDGTVSPTEGNLYAQSTTIYNYWKDRDVGIIAPQNNSDYNISKITVTDGTRNGSTDWDYNWTTNATIKWDKTTNEAGKEWYNETTVWDKTKNAGTAPVVNGAASNITWSAKNTAKLILIYLEPVEKETNLNLVYYDRTSEATILSTQVSMKYIQGETVPSYTTDLKNAKDEEIGSKKNWASTTPGEADYLPDDAYVVNSNGKKQTFSKEISTVPDVSDKYRSGLYKYDGAEISDDGKTLTLYYVADASKLSTNYVLDFGTPVEIPMRDIVENPDDLANVTWNGSALQAGDLEYDKATQTLTYTPTKVLNETYTLTFTLTYKSNQTQKVTIGVMPASNVLYEENFLTKADGWTKTETTHETAQQTQKTTDTDKFVFGYDDTYKDVTGENGAWKVDNLVVGKNSEPLTTEFYGNAFDLIGNCDKDTGRVLLLIKEKDSKNASLTLIDTRYNGGSIYQVPLAHVTKSKETTYEVKVYASGLKETTVTTPNGIATMSLDAADDNVDAQIAQILDENDLTMDDVTITSVSAMDNVDAMDVPGNGIATYASGDVVEHEPGTHVEINGFRVYRTTDKNDAVAQNYPVNEQDVTYMNILDVVKNIITAYTEADGELKINVEDYEASGGPQNEIYLASGQSVYFRADDLKGKQVQVSLRAVKADATASVKDTTISLTSNTEMYYTLTANDKGEVTIVNNGTGLLAIGNVKLANAVSKESIQSASEAGNEAVLDALKAVLNTSEEPAEVFTPETFTAKTTSTKVIRNKVVTLKVNVSSDVAYVTVNGVKYTRTGLQSMFQKTRTIRVVNTVPKNQTKTYEIIAYNADGVASEAITVTG